MYVHPESEEVLKKNVGVEACHKILEANLMGFIVAQTGTF